MPKKESPYYCPIFIEISDSLNLKTPLCPNAVNTDEQGEIKSVCPKTPEECLTLNNILASDNASRAVLTDGEIEQERLIAKWMEENGINPSSLL